MAPAIGRSSECDAAHAFASAFLRDHYLSREFFQNFTEIRVMTEGGPGESSNVLIWYLWENAFIFLQLGIAAAVAWIMFVVLMVLTGRSVLGWQALGLLRGGIGMTTRKRKDGVSWRKSIHGRRAIGYILTLRIVSAAGHRIYVALPSSCSRLR